jgi:hypothetical protein
LTVRRTSAASSSSWPSSSHQQTGHNASAPGVSSVLYPQHGQRKRVSSGLSTVHRRERGPGGLHEAGGAFPRPNLGQDAIDSQKRRRCCIAEFIGGRRQQVNRSSPPRSMTVWLCTSKKCSAGLLAGCSVGLPAHVRSLDRTSSSGHGPRVVDEMT